VGVSTHPEQARPGNVNGVRHGAQSVQLVRSRATVEKRRLLRQIGLRQDDLESLGRALLTNWARCAAILRLLDEHAEQVGWFDDDGDPRHFTKLYMAALNSERRALHELSLHLRADRHDAASALDRPVAPVKVPANQLIVLSG
jgi:hypothetical protein